ncbi:MAG: gamma-glutamylcyclotransferase [Ilumatobacter sp.]|nr:gamma-glutamylcyclotransferase [Ilumatobacter sp.]
MTGRASITHLFVYGTLRPGDVRWSLLAPYVADDGVADTVSGSVFDTGRDYPAAVFGNSGTIRGRTYRLRAPSIADCLAALDHEEGTVEGAYRRVVVTTGGGVAAWAYEYGRGLDLIRIASGDWFDR